MRIKQESRSIPTPTRSISIKRKAEVEHIMANPHEILFTNPEIMDCFSCGREVSSTIEDLRCGRTSVDDIPVIRVIRRQGKLATLDHRRLYAFQQALPKDAQIPVTVFLSELPPGMYEGQLGKDEHPKWRRAVRVEKTRLVLTGSSSCPNLGNELASQRKRLYLPGHLSPHTAERVAYYKQLGLKPDWLHWYEPDYD